MRSLYNINPNKPSPCLKIGERKTQLSLGWCSSIPGCNRQFLSLFRGPMEEKWLLPFGFLCRVCVRGGFARLHTHGCHRAHLRERKWNVDSSVSFPRFPHLLLPLVSPSASLTIVLLTLVQPHRLDPSPPKSALPCAKIGTVALIISLTSLTWILPRVQAEVTHVAGKGPSAPCSAPVGVFSAGALRLQGTEVWAPWAASSARRGVKRSGWQRWAKVTSEQLARDSDDFLHHSDGFWEVCRHPCWVKNYI